MTVGISVQTEWVLIVTTERIFRQEPGCGTVIVTGIQIIQSGFLVVLITCVGDAVIRISGPYNYVTERIIAIGSGNRTGRRIH